ncbi:hypothetical protein ISCGN_014087 [Ixodes scapularis]
MLKWCHERTEEELICGDFNAHNVAWGSLRTDRRGDALMRVIEKLGLAVANDGQPTFFRPPNSYSAIDVTAHSPSLEIKWELAPDTRGSDHFPIGIAVRGCEITKKVRKSCVNWDVFRTALDLSQGDIPSAIIAAIKKATKTTNISEWLPKPDLMYLNLAAERIRAQRRFRKTGSAHDKSDFNKISAKLRRHAKSLVRNRWALLCKNADAHTSMIKLWKILGAMTGKGRSRHSLQTLALSSNKSAEEAAEDLCARYAPVEAPERPREPNMTPRPIDSPFTVQELQSALKKCRKKSAVGPDGIPYQALTNLTHEAQQAMVNWFNKIWETGDVPEGWKLADIIPLLKTGKPPGRAESYRPVALTSCVSKLFERLLQARLSWYLEKHEGFPKCTTRFRKGLTAQDSILDLTSDLEDNKYRRRNTVVVFLDVERAYDGVPLSAILGMLTDIGLTGKIQAFLGNSLTGRRIQIRDSGIVSTPRIMHRGLPQGSVLSPTLFNIVMAKLPQSIPRSALPVQMSIYADVICLARTSSTAAFYIPETGAVWSGKLEVPTSSTTAELVAIEKALNAAAELPPQQIVILSDSKCALQRLVSPSVGDPLTTAIRNTVGELEKQGTAVYLQWIPGDVGVKRNEKADSLATEAHKKTASITIPADPRRVIQDVQWHVRSERPEPALSRGTLVGFSRAASTLVRRLRTNTAYTNEFLHRIGRIPDPRCPSCNEVESVEHILSEILLDRKPPQGAPVKAGVWRVASPRTPSPAGGACNLGARCLDGSATAKPLRSPRYPSRERGPHPQEKKSTSKGRHGSCATAAPKGQEQEVSGTSLPGTSTAFWLEVVVADAWHLVARVFPHFLERSRHRSQNLWMRVPRPPLVRLTQKT